MARNRKLPGWAARPGCIQLVLALSAVLYLASLWLFPQLNPVVGLLLVIWLSATGGTIVFFLSLRSTTAASPATRPSRSDALPATPSASPITTPEAASHPLSTTRPNAPLAGETRPAERVANASAEPAAAPLRQAERQRMTWLRLARRAAHESGDLPAEAGHLAELGSAYRHFGQPYRAVVCYHAAFTLVRQTGDLDTESMVLGDLGLAYADLGNPGQAVDCYEQHLRLVRANGDRLREARASWNLGLAYEELGDLPRAIAAMAVCINYERAIGYPEAETDASLVDQLRARLTSETPERSEPPPSPER